MERTLKILIIIVVLLNVGLWLNSRRLKPPVAVEQPVPIKTVAIAAPPPRVVASDPIRTLPKLPALPSPRASGGLGIPPKPDGNIIEFRVVDGLAIAYGDVILGRPDSGAEGVRGRYEAPTPQLWDRPEIPYLINPSLPNPKRVEQALDYLRQHTPVNFVPYQGQRDAVIFEPGPQHCYSQLGRVGGLQSIKLADGCQWPEILHETMHALGFVHEQSRPDRDQYLEVLWQNIDEPFKPQFAVVPDTFLEDHQGFAVRLSFHHALRADGFRVGPRPGDHETHGCGANRAGHQRAQRGGHSKA